MEITGGRWCPLPGRVETGYQDGDHVFVGVHERQLDPKGRLALPAAFRPRLEPRCYLAFGQDMCVDVLSAEAFEAEAAEVEEASIEINLFGFPISFQLGLVIIKKSF